MITKQKNGSAITCIYCGKPCNPRGAGDHVIPAALGEFLADTHFRHVCVGCNSKIGGAEQQLLQCGPEAVERLAMSIKRRRRREGKRPALIGARGMPAPSTVVETPRGPRFVELIDARACTPIEEVIVKDENDEWHRIRLVPKMNSQALRRKVRELAVKQIRMCSLFASAANFDYYLGLFKEAWPESETTTYEQEPVGVQPVEAKTTFTVSVDYFQSIAKIAFHHYLVFSSSAVGNEPEFEPIRRFIVDGGDRKQFVVTRPRFAVAVWKGHSHPHYSHYVAYDESGDCVNALVWLFVKDDPATVPYYLQWAKRRTPLILPRPRCAHEYRYESVGSESSAVGRVYEKTVVAFPGQQLLTIV